MHSDTARQTLPWPIIRTESDAAISCSRRRKYVLMRSGYAERPALGCGGEKCPAGIPILCLGRPRPPWRCWVGLGWVTI